MRPDPAGPASSISAAKKPSNICSNQALCALRSLMHVDLLGPEGLKKTAQLGIERAHYAAERLGQLPECAWSTNPSATNSRRAARAEAGDEQDE